MAEEPGRLVLTWQNCADLTARLADEIRSNARQPDVILAISRGGLMPAVVMATLLDMKDVLCAALSSYVGEERGSSLQIINFPTREQLGGRRVLIVDDVWDSGRTAVTVRNRVISLGALPILSVLHYKPARSIFPDQQPDIWAETTDAWVVYPWETLFKLSSPRSIVRPR